MEQKKMEKSDLWEQVRRSVREREEVQRTEPKLKDLSWALGKEDELKNEIKRFMCNRGRLLRKADVWWTEGLGAEDIPTTIVGFRE